MALYDNGATGGGTLLESITVTGQMAPWRGQTNAIVTGGSVLHPLLVAGTTYWLVVSEPNPLTDETVWGNALPIGQVNPSYLRVGSGAWAPYNGVGQAFQISGLTPVPEPSMGLLIGITALIALSGVLWRRYRRNSAAALHVADGTESARF